jgi:hypothetical protein
MMNRVQALPSRALSLEVSKAMCTQKVRTR